MGRQTIAKSGSLPAMRRGRVVRWEPIKRWSPKTASWWLAAVGSTLALFPPTRRLAGALFIILSIGGVGAVYGNSAGTYGLPVQPVPVIGQLILARDKGALKSAVVHGVWAAPGLYLLKAGK